MSSFQVTSIVRATVKPENFERYREMTEMVTEVCSQFTGYQGTRIVEPTDPSAVRVTIFSFDSYENYRLWEKSIERHESLEKLDQFIEGEASREQISGLNYWMSPALNSNSWPPSWRMAVVAFLAIFPLSHLIPPLVRPLLPNYPFLGSVLAIAAVTILMSYFSLPLMVRLFRKWLGT